MFPPCQWFEKLPNYHIPEFQSNASEIHVILWILNFENEVIEEITPDDTPFIQEFVQANPQIYKLISQNPQVNAVQMSESMGVSRRQVQKHLKRLQE
ncbi:winged helix-turn-helix transcriptional regulator [Bacteroides sp. OF04-15BH]|uniref:winged helix-turn-helix transcriptional regulator n=1 Tax=Bacteroides sp. OF04-15BH TaxID=2292281 RepID=UPI003519EFC8